MDEWDEVKDFDHMHIVRVYDTYEDNNHFYVITEKVEAGSVHDRLADLDYFSEKTVG